MGLKLTNISEQGKFERERVVMRAEGETEIGDYAVFCCKAGSDGIPLSGAMIAGFWFQNKIIKDGDLLVLYSRAGLPSEKVNDGGHTSHFFYWGAS